MKKLIALVMAGVMVVSLGTTALAAGGHHGRGAGSGQGQGMGQNWVDADGDGVCDNYQNGGRGQGGRFRPRGWRREWPGQRLRPRA